MYLTGRSELDLLDTTTKWLTAHDFPRPDNVIYFPRERTPWTWKKYLEFKKDMIKMLVSKHGDLEPIVIDDNAAVLRESARMGLESCRIKSPRDWLFVSERYLASTA